MGGIGGSIALATRGGIFLPIVALVGGSLFLWLVAAWRAGSLHRLIRPTLVSLSALGLPMLFVWLTDPVVRISPLRWLYDSYAYSGGDFPWVVATRTNGVDVPMNDMPWWFVPAWLAAQLPLLIAATTLSTLLLLFLALSSSAVRRRFIPAEKINGLVPFAVQGFALPLAAIVTGAQFYDGIRHLIFMIPVIALASTLTIYVLMEARAPTVRAGGIMLAVVILGANVWADVRWFPYDYAFINPIAGRDKEQRQWELDYWGVSTREGVERLQEMGLEDIVVLPHGEPGRPYGAVNFSDPGSGIIDPVVFVPKPGQDFGYYWFNRFDYPDELKDCTPLFTIERDGHVLGEGGRCSPMP